MATVAEILAESFAKIRSKGIVIGTSTSEEAEFLNISAGHLSRIRNERVPLTDDLIAKIVTAFAKDDTKSADLLRERLIRAKMRVHSRVQTSAHERSATPARSRSEYSIELVSVLFKRLSAPDSFLAVDYRDLPQTRKGGRYPEFALEAAEAVKKGLSFALFQPFGNPDLIRVKRDNLPDQPGAKLFFDACHYLYELTTGVRDVYHYIKNAAEQDGPCKGSIVLYEAVRMQDGKEVAPSLAACGIQSRLFYADYNESPRHYQEVYEWVVAHPDGDCFIPRGEASINPTAVRTQFSPILNYWEEHGHTLPDRDTLPAAYKEFIEPLFGKDAGGETRWQAWTEEKQ